MASASISPNAKEVALKSSDYTVKGLSNFLLLVA